MSRELLSIGLAGLVALLALGVSPPTRAENPTPYPDTVVTPTRHSYSALVEPKEPEYRRLDAELRRAGNYVPAWAKTE